MSPAATAKIGIAEDAVVCGIVSPATAGFGDLVAARDQQALMSAVVAAVLPPPTLAAAQAAPPLAGFQQATQSGFNSINSTLMFGAPVDVAAGGDARCGPSMAARAARVRPDSRQLAAPRHWARRRGHQFSLVVPARLLQSKRGADR